MPESKVNIHLFQLFPWEIHTDVERYIFSKREFDELIIHRCSGGLSSAICEHLYFQSFHSNDFQPSQHICSECRLLWERAYMPSGNNNNFRVNTLDFDLNQSDSFTQENLGVDTSFQSELYNRSLSQYFKRLRTTDSKNVANYVGPFLNSKKFNILFRSVVGQIKNTFKPGERNIAYLFNGRFFMYYIILHALKELRIPTIIHERGGIKQSTALSLNVGFGNNNELYRSFKLDYYKSITQNDINSIYDYQIMRCYQGEANNFSTVCTIDDSEKQSRSTHVSVLDSIKYICYFTSSSEEYFADDQHCSYESQLKAIVSLAEYAKQFSYRLVVRIHPNSIAGIQHPIAASSFLKSLYKLSLDYDIVLIYPNEKVSAYGLISYSKAIFVDTSHVFLESLMAGHPAFITSNSASMILLHI